MEMIDPSYIAEILIPPDKLQARIHELGEQIRVGDHHARIVRRRRMVVVVHVVDRERVVGVARPLLRRHGARVRHFRRKPQSSRQAAG